MYLYLFLHLYVYMYGRHPYVCDILCLIITLHSFFVFKDKEEEGEEENQCH